MRNLDDRYKRFRIGFVIDGRFPSLQGAFSRECGIFSLLQGCASDSSVGLMRFGWIADAINRSETLLRYELYRPWRRYDAVVFLKSMGNGCLNLAWRLKKGDAKILFDVNVDYLTPAEGTFYYEGMAPTEVQRLDALSMLEIADNVIADSEYIAEKCLAYHQRVEWIPDNVNMNLVPPARPCLKHDRLTVLWSGASCKIFDLLLIAPVLKTYADRLRFILIMDDWVGVERCFELYRQEIKDLLASLEHQIVPFRSIEQLLEIYADGDVFISPRFLDNTYNLGHTEWKIALPMACGCFVLASPQPSYLTVYRRSLGKGMRICADTKHWHEEMDAILGGKIDREEEGKEGRRTIETYYSTRVVAQQHAEMMRKVLQMGAADCSA